MRATALLFLALAACADTASVSDAVRLSPTQVETTINTASVLSVDLPAEITAEVAVRTPAEEFVYLHIDGAAELWPFGSQPATLELNVDSVRGVVFRDGSAIPVNAFDGPGSYEVIVADNLETEPENTMWQSYPVVLTD